jgi:hypothetical protein
MEEDERDRWMKIREIVQVEEKGVSYPLINGKQQKEKESTE